MNIIGMFEIFGPKRIVDTPITEAGIFWDTLNEIIQSPNMNC